MEELKHTTDIVKNILEHDEHARNCDGYLYLKVLNICGKEKGLDMNTMTVADFLLNRHEYALPPAETVRRTRQKVQQEFPELAAKKPVQLKREAEEKKFREYARGAV